MRARANPTLIGAFVVGAIALIVSAVLLIAGGRLFSDMVELVAFFPGSVNGLAVGAPVKFKGVEIGQVTKIQLSVDEAYQTDFHIPVFFELDPEKMTSQGAVVTATDLRDKGILKDLYDNGLRAQLVSESILTGVLYVELDMHPGTEYELHLDADSELLEMPTLPTAIEQATTAAKQILAKFEELDVKSLLNSLNQTIGDVQKLVSSPELREVAKNLNRTLSKADEAAVSIRELADSTKNNVDSLSRSVEERVIQSKETLTKLDTMLEDASTALNSMSTLIEPGSPVVYQLAQVLRSLDDAARSVRRLADSLDRNPSSLVYGRAEDGVQ